LPNFRQKSQTGDTGQKALSEVMDAHVAPRMRRPKKPTSKSCFY